MLQKLKEICAQYEISDYFAMKLRQLEGWEIALICDDSGSMSAPLSGTNKTRWDELKETVGIIVNIAGVMDKDGE